MCGLQWCVWSAHRQGWEQQHHQRLLGYVGLDVVQRHPQARQHSKAAARRSVLGRVSASDHCRATWQGARGRILHLQGSCACCKGQDLAGARLQQATWHVLDLPPRYNISKALQKK